MKKILTSITTLILVLTLALPGVSAQENQVFDDVPTNHPNFKDINYLVEKGILSQGGKYRPSDLISREETVVMVAKAIGLDGTPRETKFEDVPKSNKNSGYIQSAAEIDVIYGMNFDEFKPENKLTRSQMSLVLARAFNLPIKAKGEEVQVFKDVWLGTNFAGSVEAIVNAGITTGYADGTFKPHASLTRAHMAAFLARAMKYAENNI